MELTRRAFLGGVAATAIACDRSRSEEEPLRRGVSALLALQSADGGFHSTTYGFLRSGMSLGPLAVLALASLPAHLVPTDRLALAVDFLVGVRSPDGALGLTDGVLDYPVYATGLFLSALAATEPPGWATTATASVAWLRSQQLRDGWEGTAAHGGFPMGAREIPPPGAILHVDLSMTRRAIEGLVAAGVPPDDPALRAGLGFVQRCATADGGFLYSPVEDGVNKGERAEGRSLAYGTATCDGILALAALGQDVAGSLAWLHAHHRLDVNPGVGAGYGAFATAMRFLYREGAATVFARHGGPSGWEAALRADLLAEQREDGSWANPESLQKEDDPIVATSLALRALALTTPRGAGPTLRRR